MFRLLFLFLLLFDACQKKPDSNEHCLRINMEMDPQTLDPRKGRDLRTITLLHMLFEGLTRTSPTGETELALAETVEVSEDSSRYVFHLRKSVWSNGDPVTAADFAYAWKTILDPLFPTDMASQLYPIKNARRAKMGEVDASQIGIQAPDPETLIVELEKPTPYFLELVSMTPFFPIHEKTDRSKRKWALDPSSHIGNGPFSIRLWNHGDRILLSKNLRYWESEKVKINELDLLMVVSDTEMRMFEDGELDWAGSPLSSIPPDSVGDLKSKKILRDNPLSGTIFFRLNTADRIGTKKNPVSNLWFRKALALSLDRAALSKHVLQGGQLPAMSLVPPAMGLSKDGYFLDADREKALELLHLALKEMDLDLSDLEPLVISFKASNKNSPLVQAIQEQWEQTLGIKVHLEAVEPKVFFQRISLKDFQLIVSDWIADFNDPINFLDVFKYKSASTNCTNWESAKYIDLLDQSDLCGDVKERKRLLAEAEKVLMDQMPIIPIVHHTFNYMRKGSLHNVALSPIGQIDFRWAQIEESSQKLSK